EVDRVVAGDLERLSVLGTRRLAGLVRAETYRRDPASAVARVARAEADRFVSCRPAPDCMVQLTCLLPVAQGVAAYAALVRAADTAQARGDGRTRGQVMADELVIRITGQARADAVPLAVHLVMPADTLLARGSQSARVVGHGPVPAEVARRLVAAAPRLASWVRRLYAEPHGRLVAMDSDQRYFPHGLAEFITLRDDTCRTPYCDAPIRHIDHITPYADGGPTSETNGQGLCERCNHARQAPGWSARTVFRDIVPGSAPGAAHEVVLTTPTEHRNTSRSPNR
ncbi:MAG TPA: HNH endonuclease, partial [Propionibacteriaceae bacterium]|nr:HNH endonuclease [Propionibacteriaceae bacterium]